MRVVALVPSTFNALESLEGTKVHDVESLRANIADADVLVLAPRYGAMIRDVWADAKKLRWIHSLGAGVETFPFDLLARSEVVVTNSRGVYSAALAEFAIGAMLWFAKDFRRLVRNQESRTWEPFPVQRLEGATVGIIGYGSIGRAVGSLAEAFGMRILTRRRESGTSIEQVLRDSDYVVLSAPLTPETRRLIDGQRIALMRESAVLINISRGAIVDEEALVAALASNRIRGAGLDVFETEPLPAESPLWALQNVLISPHNADRTRDSHERAVAFFATNLERFRRGEPLQNIVDPASRY
jgi:phosphoglycerate dehydrogenase-like enzyme